MQGGKAVKACTLLVVGILMSGEAGGGRNLYIYQWEELWLVPESSYRA